MNTLSYISSETEEEAEKRQCIEDTKYYIQCKEEEISMLKYEIEDITDAVKESRKKIKDFIVFARNRGILIVKLMEEKKGLEEDLRDLQTMPDEDMGRDR